MLEELLSKEQRLVLLVGILISLFLLIVMIIPACCTSSSSIRFMRNPCRYARFRSSSRMPHIPCLSSAASNSHTPATTSTTATTPTPVETKPKPWLLVGLGNPGKKYNGTRHNVGFEMIDAIAEAEGIPMSSVSFNALFGKGSIGNVPVILAKPQTFMNVSGQSVGPLVSYYKIPLKQVLVMFDDLDLPFASLRLLPKGGHGGHNGMRSIIKHFKDNRDFPRLRIGIGRPPGKMDAANFVLKPFNKQERQELDFTFQDGVEAIRILLVEGVNKSATFVNTKKSLKQLN